MAKVQAPLFSVSASGTVAKQLTYRATKRGAVVSAPGIPGKQPNENQTRERARFAAALTAWRGLDSFARSKWITLALAHAIAPHKLFTQNYLSQRCEGDQLPRFPPK